jgi:hypothetical protein
MADDTEAKPFATWKPRPKIIKTAVISPCGKYRYRLTRAWGNGWFLPFVMLNPSTADANFDDPTIRRCIGFARREGANAIVVVNLFAFRATDPKAMLAEPHRVGPENERAIYEVAQDAKRAKMPIICAWGAQAGNHAMFTVDYLRAQGAALMCLGKTKDGHPRHPLYVKGDHPLEIFP